MKNVTIKNRLLLLIQRMLPGEKQNSGAELVQVAILVAIAVAVGLIFKNEITAFVNNTFDSLNSDFT